MTARTSSSVADLQTAPPLPIEIAGLAVPQDEVSGATWAWAHRSLPDYLLTHSVRAYAWGARIATLEDWQFDPRILWTASLMHDLGLARIGRNTMCFEVEGAEIAQAFLTRRGMPANEAERVAIAIILHMRAGVTLADGVEAVLLDRATGLDVRGDGFELVEDVRPAVMARFPRREFDRHFTTAIRREVAVRPNCQSTRLLNETGLEAWMARSPWAVPETGG
jgi:cyanamide hydratase family protein with HD domain